MLLINSIVMFIVIFVVSFVFIKLLIRERRRISKIEYRLCGIEGTIGFILQEIGKR